MEYDSPPAGRALAAQGRPDELPASAKLRLLDSSFLLLLTLRARTCFPCFRTCRCIAALYPWPFRFYSFLEERRLQRSSRGITPCLFQELSTAGSSSRCSLCSSLKGQGGPTPCFTAAFVGLDSRRESRERPVTERALPRLTNSRDSSRQMLLVQTRSIEEGRKYLLL